MRNIKLMGIIEDIGIMADQKTKVNKQEQRFKDLKALKKEEQINLLLELGYPTRSTYSLRYEADRVNKIIELQDKKK